VCRVSECRIPSAVMRRNAKKRSDGVDLSDVSERSSGPTRPFSPLSDRIRDISEGSRTVILFCIWVSPDFLDSVVFLCFLNRTE